MSMKKTTGILVTGVVAGTLIGTTVALLVAPNSGKNNRQAIGKKSPRSGDLTAKNATNQWSHY